MKKVYVTDGWDEITTKQIRVTLKVNKVFSTAGQWVDFGKKYPKMYHGNRHHCDRCETTWESLPPEASTYLLQTTKGNKILYENCFNAIQIPTYESRTI